MLLNGEKDEFILIYRFDCGRALISFRSLEEALEKNRKVKVVLWRRKRAKSSGFRTILDFE